MLPTAPRSRRLMLSLGSAEVVESTGGRSVGRSYQVVRHSHPRMVGTSARALDPNAVPLLSHLDSQFACPHAAASPARILGAFRIMPGEHVLEVGPGTGFYSVEAARNV